jgi:DNA-directed RNA polymerase specialized sigma24 family protein
MLDDAQLVRLYAVEKSEAAFAELVRRHLDLVYSAALRQVGGDAHRAHDVAQTVFIALARKADAVADTGAARVRRWGGTWRSYAESRSSAL